MNWQHIDLKQMAFLRETPVRQALDFATPRERIIAEILSGRAIPAFADQSPESWAYSETLRPRPFNPERATSLLDEAGLLPGDDGVRARDGKRFEIDLWGVQEDDRARAIARDDRRRVERHRGLDTDAVRAAGGAVGAARLPVLRPHDRLSLHLDQRQRPGRPLLLALLADPGQPRRAPAATCRRSSTPTHSRRRSTPSPPKPPRPSISPCGRTLYGEIQALLLEEVPVIFLYWEEAFPAARAHVGGFWPSAWTPLLWNAADWYLAEA